MAARTHPDEVGQAYDVAVTRFLRSGDDARLRPSDARVGAAHERNVLIRLRLGRTLRPHHHDQAIRPVREFLSDILLSQAARQRRLSRVRALV